MIKKQRNVRQGACSAKVAAERISAKGFADPYTSSFGCSDFYLPAVSPALLDEGICVNILKTKDWPKGRGQAGATTFLLAKNIF